jgi:hypothetical protein
MNAWIHDNEAMTDWKSSSRDAQCRTPRAVSTPPRGGSVGGTWGRPLPLRQERMEGWLMGRGRRQQQKTGWLHCKQIRRTSDK